MKYVLISLIAFAFLLTACMEYPVISDQNVESLDGEPIAEEVKEIPVQPVQNKTETEPAEIQNKTEPVKTEKEPEQTPQLVSATNMTLTSQDANNLYSVKGDVHTIEVVDVTEAEDGCLIGVDGVMDLVDLDETKTINGVKITVLDVRAIRSQLRDNDICQIIVR